MAHRIEQVNKLIRRELSEIIQHQLKDPRLDALVTVTDVSTSPDLRYAKVFVSRVGDDEEKKQEIMKVLSIAARFMRKELMHNVSLRRVPELAFFWDDSIKQGIHISQLIDRINNEEPNDSLPDEE